MYDGMNLYRAIVAYSSPTTGEIQVRIPSILGPTEVVPVSRIGRADSNGTWQVPLVGSQTVVAVEDDRFSHVYMVYPNLGTISAGGGGGGGTDPQAPLVPPGSIIQYAGSSAPTGWLLCNGEPVSRTTYADLFEAIGTTYGVGDNSTTFNLPNMQGRVAVGADPLDPTFATLNSPGGEKAITLSTAQLPIHSHSGTASGGSHGHTGSSSGGSHGHTGSSSGGSHNHTGSSNSTGSHSHTVPYFVDLSQSGGSGTGSVGSAGNVNVNTSSAGGHSHTITVDTDTSHTHTVTVDTSTSHAHTVTVDTSTSHAHTITIDNTGSGQAHNNLQPYIVVNYIIKV